MKAIETYYNGYHFRSRTEARWAVFFDALKIKFQYEVEGYELSDGRRYLPDFKIISPITKFNYWYEVKPGNGETDGKMEVFEKDIFEDERQKGESTNYCETIFGDPYTAIVENGFIVCPRCGLIMKEEIDNSKEDWWVTCFPCDMTTPCGGDNKAEAGLIITTWPHKGVLKFYSGGLKEYQKKVIKAIRISRAARFEFKHA